MLSDVLNHNIESNANVNPNLEGANKASKEKKKWQLPKISWSQIRRFFSHETVDRLEEEGHVFLSMISFFGLLLLFLLELVWKGISKIGLLRGATRSAEAFWSSHLGRVGERIINALESKRGGVRRSFLISLAFRNMSAKKTRSFVTVGGMSVGIGAIVFLVSIGYGLQRLVVAKVARLEELKMADVTLGQSSSVRLNDEALANIGRIGGVERVMPLVSLVGKINYGGGVAESVVYGVGADYLVAAGLNKVKGDYYEGGSKVGVGEIVPKVAGVATEWKWELASYGKRARNVVFQIEPETYLRVRAAPNTSAEVIGYVKRVEGGFEGVEYWGESYLGDYRGQEGKDDEGKVLGRWIKAPYPLWQKEGNEYKPMYDMERVQEWREGYVAELDVVIDEDATSYVQWEDATDYGKVLGEATASAQVASSSAAAIITESESSPEASIAAVVVGTDANGVEWVSLGDSASASASPQVMVIDVPETTQKEAVVNKALIEMLGIELNEAVGSSFEISFVILNTLKPDLDRPAESAPTKYLIRAVIDEGNAPLIYVPIGDITALGTTNYSQAKVVVADKDGLGKVRQQVDNLGYKTNSVADTVAQIDRLFATARVVLATFGLVALAVASLGMFNTLTVSLMERTREVGIMKAMGMQSIEVKELFLAEAMVMGILGGVFGVGMGWTAGKLLGVILSAFSLIKGVGWIDISYIPPLFVAFVLVLSFIVGVITGIYPARRATKISALNALRYE